MPDTGNLRVTAGSRRPDKDTIIVDLNDAADYPKRREFDAVINCAALPSERYEPLGPLLSGLTASAYWIQQPTPPSSSCWRS